MSDKKKQERHGAGGVAANNVVVPFQAPNKPARKQPPPTDDEIAEYRRIRPVLMQMLEQWPKLLREHQAITSNCVLARKILAGDA